MDKKIEYLQVHLINRPGGEEYNKVKEHFNQIKN